ncbi:MAG TPA: hypothetical protein VHD60_02970 [Candidatus Saccharimonadales bacterium]|nr:hypothetical protein [Candidatus Saccharimonadales bacterium]
MATNKKEKRKVIDKTLTAFGVVATVLLLAVGSLAWWASSFTTTNVHDQLADQKIYFPEKGSAALTSLPATDQAQVSKYAGQQVLTGAQAKVFADNYIAVHLEEIGGGKTYSEVSALAQKDPTNTKLQNEANTLFKGETLRGLLLGDAYAFGTVGAIAGYAAIASFVAAGVMFVLVLLGLRHLWSL